MTPAQLRTVARTMTPDQLDALARLLIEHDPALARLLIDAAIAECPISPSNPPRRLETPDADERPFGRGQPIPWVERDPDRPRRNRER